MFSELHHSLHITWFLQLPSVYGLQVLRARAEWILEKRHQWSCSVQIMLLLLPGVHKLDINIMAKKLNYSVHVKIVSDDVVRVDGGQCKVWRNVMTLWHLVQIDSRSNRQTQKRQTLGQTGRQTGQVHGQHSVVWHQESDGSREVRGAGLSPHLLPGRVQWILADRGEEDTSCPSARLSAHNCAP